MNNKVIDQNLGKATGEDRIYSILGFIWSDPNLPLAIDHALKVKNADALINLEWQEKYVPFLLFSYTDYIVTGESVKFKQETVIKKKNKKEKK